MKRVTISFIIAGVSCVLNALCYAELASRFPAVVGGAYLYTYSAFNEITAFLVFTQLMLDYHIGAASIARSLASYVVTVLELILFLKDNIPSWGVGESSILNSIMTVTKILIVLFVIIVGAFKVNVSNWTPFAPNGFKSILTGATVVFFAYVGFDAVANSAEESKKPQRDLPLGIIGSLMVCVALYIGVCLVITGMVPYQYLGEEAPLAEAFTSKGLKYVSVLISFCCCWTYNNTFGWALCSASTLACLLNVHVLSHILSVGSLHNTLTFSSHGKLLQSTLFQHVWVRLRWKDETSSQASTKLISSRAEGIIYLLAIACCGFTAGVLFRFGASFIFLIVAAVIGILSAAALYVRQ
ncbi:UNVERIFIED_CONTAM: Cationic amino acid transporter 9, chloroplastic [Sesamum radiatum]|uniref:Cationic amino acid transporter 9, chloroplastic n=1 Tax=Sesamum radiatum TaxID=300843 RepID=A0AAW2VJD0_SESRA